MKPITLVGLICKHCFVLVHFIGDFYYQRRSHHYDDDEPGCLYLRINSVDDCI